MQQSHARRHARRVDLRRYRLGRRRAPRITTLCSYSRKLVSIELFNLISPRDKSGKSERGLRGWRLCPLGPATIARLKLRPPFAVPRPIASRLWEWVYNDECVRNRSTPRRVSSNKCLSTRINRSLRVDELRLFVAYVHRRQICSNDNRSGPALMI